METTRYTIRASSSVTVALTSGNASMTIVRTTNQSDELIQNLRSIEGQLFFRHQAYRSLQPGLSCLIGPRPPL